MRIPVPQRQPRRNDDELWPRAHFGGIVRQRDRTGKPAHAEVVRAIVQIEPQMPVQRLVIQDRPLVAMPVQPNDRLSQAVVRAMIASNWYAARALPAPRWAAKAQSTARSRPDSRARYRSREFCLQSIPPIQRRMAPQAKGNDPRAADWSPCGTLRNPASQPHIRTATISRRCGTIRLGSRARRTTTATTTTTAAATAIAIHTTGLAVRYQSSSPRRMARAGHSAGATISSAP